MSTQPIPMPASGIAKPIAVGAGGSSTSSTIPGAATGTAGAGGTTATNPMIPVPVAQPALNTTGGAQVAQSSDPNQTNLQKQETDIYGKGVGGEITNLLDNISGVESASLSDYVKSLQPQEAQAQTNVNAQLGASGVSANSSVAAIADSNLQAQETAAIAGESAQLRTQGEQLEAGILTGQQQQSAQEVSASGWSVFGDVLGAIGTDAASAAGSIAKVAGL